jgi:hypothetical protein
MQALFCFLMACFFMMLTQSFQAFHYCVIARYEAISLGISVDKLLEDCFVLRKDVVFYSFFNLSYRAAARYLHAFIIRRQISLSYLDSK